MPAGVNITGVQDVVIGSSMHVYNNLIYKAASGGGAGPSVSTPVSPGEVRVSATVTASYLFG